MTQDADVVVAGAGPVGLTVALFLARQGVRVTVLERGEQLSDSPRAMVYLHSLLPDLAALGVLDSMRAKGVVDHSGLNVHLAATGEIISIPNTALAGEVEYPFNVHLGQGQYCEIVLAELYASGSATMRFGTEVTGISQDADGVSVHITSNAGANELRAGWLVGADGGQSVVRKGIGGILEGFTWEQRFVATNVRHPFETRGFFNSNMYVHPEIGSIVSRITADGLWRVTYQEDADLPEETIPERIAAHFDRLLDGAAYELDAFQPYKMHQRLSSTLRDGRVVLAGDAAHLTNPTGGLGLTTGLYDVILLQEVLLAVLTGAPETLLDEYASKRSAVFSTVTSPAASALKRLLYESTTPTLLEEQAGPLREAAQTVDGQRAFLHGLDAMRSPALTSHAS